MFKKSASIFFFTFLFLASRTVAAGGPIHVSEGGVASSWDETISLHPEAGTCGPFSRDEMISKLEEKLGLWEKVTGAGFEISLDESVIGVDIDGDNFGDFYSSGSSDSDADDGVNPVMFDDDGAIVRSLFGSPNEFFFLGFAGPDAFDDDGETIIAGEVLINCLCLLDEEACSGIVFTEDDLHFTVVHEVGHMIGLDHTQVNQSIAEGECDITDDGDCDNLPTMYPVSIDPADQLTPQRDDEVALLNLYGLSSLDDGFCTVTGDLKDKNGKPLRCADVQAVTSDTTDTIAVVSGGLAPNDDLDGDEATDGDGECTDDCGEFILRGLSTEKEISMVVRPIDSTWIGGSGINPCVNGQIAGIVEETIATLSVGDCSAGEKQKLGTVTTASSGGIDEGGENDSDSGASSDDPFADLPPLIDCSLTTSPTDPATGFSVMMMALVSGIFLVVIRTGKSALDNS